MRINFTVKRSAFYVFGCFLTAFGVNLLLRSDLGAGPWDTVTYSLSALSGLTLGTSSALINALLILFIIVANKKMRYFLLVVPAFFISVFIDVWDLLILGDFYPNILWLKLLFYISGFYVITLGLAIIVATDFVAMIFEELTHTLMRLFKIKQFAYVRIFLETFAVLTAMILGAIASIGFGAINIGTVIMAIFIGPIIAINLKFIIKIKHAFVKSNEER